MAEKLFYGPLWPLPKPNLQGALTSGLSGAIETSEYYEAAAKDVIVSAPSTNSGDVYLLIRASDGTFKRTNDGTVVLTVSPGGSRNIPQANYGGNRYQLSELGIDADESYDNYFVCAIMQ